MKKNKILNYLSAGIIAISSAGCFEKVQAIQEQKTNVPITQASISQGIYSNPIIIDPGHGGLDSGAYVDKVSESSITYDISVRLKKALEENNYSVYQTVFNKTLGFEPQDTLNNLKDSYLVYSNRETFDLTKKALDERCMVIKELTQNSINPMLVSIHVNSASPKIKGADIFYPLNKDYCSINGEITSKILSQRINTSFLENNVLINYDAKLEPDEIFADYLPNLGNVHGTIHSNGYRLKIFSKTSLTNLETKILIEVGNLQNKDDQKRLLDSNERQLIADSIAKGIMDYDKNEGSEFYRFKNTNNLYK
ncbi:MAG: N-acetylmuramoyl-L-alanine amidase [Candidatus Pacearchaeota archaeon]|jgi:N-acetylmuramoyl-L-alanine amidase